MKRWHPAQLELVFPVRRRPDPEPAEPLLKALIQLIDRMNTPRPRRRMPSRRKAA